MFTTLRNAWKIPELRKKILFTLFILLIFRLGNAVPVPYVNITALASYFNSQLSDTILGLYNAMSGSAFSQATVFLFGDIFFKLRIGHCFLLVSCFQKIRWFHLNDGISRSSTAYFLFHATHFPDSVVKYSPFILYIRQGIIFDCVCRHMRNQLLVLKFVQ